MPRTLAALSLLLSFACHVGAQDLQGAEAALKAVEARKTKAGGREVDLVARLESYGAGKGLSPAEAAKGWLALFDAFAAQADGPTVNFGTLVGALPAPESWDAIVAGLRSREAGKKGFFPDSVRFFAALLEGDPKSEWRALDALARDGKDPKFRAFAGGTVIQASAALANETGDPARIAAAFSASLANVGGGTVVVPDLVTLVGPQKAETLLVQAMTTSARPLEFQGAKATIALARRVALTHIKTLKAPPWGLVDVGSPNLYEALEARFGANRPPVEGRNRARYLYAFGLLRAGRRAEAVKVARSLSMRNFYDGGGVEQAIEPWLGTKAFTAFLGAAVEGLPLSPFWETYMVAAARSRESAAVVASLSRALASPKISSEIRLQLRERLANALFAADRIDEGLSVLRKSLAAAGNDRNQALHLGVRLARIGRLIDRPALVQEGLATARAAQARPLRPGVDELANSELVDLLLDLGQGAEAERLAIAAYVGSVSEGRENAYGTGYANPSLVALVNLYYRLNRPTDVRTLLDGATDWGVRDALDLTRPESSWGGDDETPLGFIVAWSLAKTGEKTAAESVLMRVLAGHGGYDPAYALLRELKGAEAIPALEAIYAADRFEERPLIWKAVALKDAGRLDEAEATVRQGIAVDPSDGETHGGRRLYAYSVLADVLEAKGDAEGAQDDRAAVAAIRLAERADEFAREGLLARAIAGYEESTRRFSAAYCIQSRLAVDLMAQGRPKEAEEHYRRAYELMPGSFGRVETHCMGCEHVFEGALAQNVAERVFTELTQKTPEKPQVFYLLGYLRVEQGRYAEALALYKRAVTLDPDYLNAWKGIATVEELVPTSPAEKRRIADAIVRLDPLQRHGNGTLSVTGDLRKLWYRVDTALTGLRIDRQEAAYPLAASTAAIDRMATMGEAYANSMMNMSAMDGGRNARTPGEAVVSSSTIQAAIQLIEVGRSSRSAYVSVED